MIALGVLHGHVDDLGVALFGQRHAAVVAVLLLVLVALGEEREQRLFHDSSFPSTVEDPMQLGSSLYDEELRLTT
jgi:hypothetical protein